MKRKLLVSVVIVGVIAILISSGVYGISKWDFSEYAQETNKVMQNKETLSAVDYIAIVNGEEFDRSRFDSYKVGLAQTGNEFTDQEIIDKLVQRTVVMQEVQKNGYTVTEEEIEAFVAETMQLVYEDPNTHEIVNQFIQDAGITMDDYKDRCRIIGRETILANKLRDDIHSQYMELTESNSEKLTKEENESFDECFAAYVDELCASADVQTNY